MDGLIAALFLMAAAQEAGIGSGDKACSLSAADMEANRRLTFEEFDQLGTTPSTGRALTLRGCYRQAVRATEDYLLFGPVLRKRERNVLTWHLGQDIASAGDEAAAAHVIATTIRYPIAEPDQFDWNTYVRGTWAFLVKDRALLDRMAEQLSRAPGERNAINAAALRGLQACFDRPYREAYHGGRCIPRP